jgi:histidinol-phosphate aminotransferase
MSGALACLRAGLPAPSSFSVSEEPHRAKLDQNESPVDLPDQLKADLTAELAALPWNRYPQPRDYAAAKAQFAAALGLAPETVCLTVGGDQAIVSAFHAAGGPGRRARWFEPTYPYISLAARMTHTVADPVDLSAPDFDGALTPEQVLAEPSPDLVVFVAPNNPTGAMPPAEAVAAALAEPRRLVFVDEAYADFCGATRITEVERHLNLAIGRSLSKGMLAGVRLGYVVGHPQLIAALEQLYTAPYHLSSLQLAVARRYADIAPHIERAAAAVVAERTRVTAALRAQPGIDPLPSCGNFVLFRVAGAPERARQVHASLAAAGIRVRDVGGLPKLAGYLRVTIGLPAENDLLLTSLSTL